MWPKFLGFFCVCFKDFDPTHEIEDVIYREYHDTYIISQRFIGADAIFFPLDWTIYIK